MNKIMSAVFAAQLESLSAINAFVTRAAEEAGLDDRAVYAVQMAVEEASANIIQHAYGEEVPAGAEIEFTCVVRQKELTLILKDEGRAFDPATVSDPDLCSPVEERQAGGLGVFFIRQLMDEVHFECEAGTTNVLTMVKRSAP
ncbi:MAG: ATP-binding protein [Anaerolineales bacterium]